LSFRHERRKDVHKKLNFWKNVICNGYLSSIIYHQKLKQDSFPSDDATLYKRRFKLKNAIYVNQCVKIAQYYHHELLPTLSNDWQHLQVFQTLLPLTDSAHIWHVWRSGILLLSGMQKHMACCQYLHKAHRIMTPSSSSSPHGQRTPLPNTYDAIDTRPWHDGEESLPLEGLSSSLMQSVLFRPVARFLGAKYIFRGERFLFSNFWNKFSGNTKIWGALPPNAPRCYGPGSIANK